MTKEARAMDNVAQLLARMKRQNAEWFDDEPYEDWWQYQRDFAQAITEIEALATALAEREADRAEIARLRAIIADANAVHVNLLRGDIARPTVHQMIHVYSPAKVRDGLETYARAVFAGSTQ